MSEEAHVTISSLSVYVQTRDASREDEQTRAGRMNRPKQGEESRLSVNVETRNKLLLMNY